MPSCHYDKPEKLKINKKIIPEIKQIHSKFKKEIENRLDEFRKTGKNAGPEELFAELAFCILTPQSKAKLCWEAILAMQKKDILLNGTSKDINKELNESNSINETKNALKVIYNEVEKEMRNVPEIKFDALDKLNETSFYRGVSRKVNIYLNELDNYYSLDFSRADRIKQKIINKNLENKSDVYYRFRDNYHNEAVSDIVKKVYETNKVLEFQNELIQHFDPVYQDPVVKGKLDFRSHFFSPKKHFWGKYYDTYWFNICVVWILTIIFYMILYFELLKKLITLSDRLKRRN